MRAPPSSPGKVTPLVCTVPYCTVRQSVRRYEAAAGTWVAPCRGIRQASCCATPPRRRVDFTSSSRSVQHRHHPHLPRAPIMSEGLFYNVANGYVEGLVRGYRNTLLTGQQYGNLTQCETIDGKQFRNSPHYCTLLTLPRRQTSAWSCIWRCPCFSTSEPLDLNPCR